MNGTGLSFLWWVMEWLYPVNGLALEMAELTSELSSLRGELRYYEMETDSLNTAIDS